ncbi:MAG TPA: hypothetical protein VNK67_00715 [Burkholderiales bacterium]|nr:hypothetical protein [Burkholderiales bacterium]
MRTRLTAPLVPMSLACLLAGTIVFPAAAAELSTQKSSDRGVTVAVTPQDLSAGAKSWDFKIVLDTHSVELDDDLVKTATLLDEKGTRHAPVKWDGAAPGGHHREGTLRFEPISPQPKSVELRIQRPGEPKPRVFIWRIK